MEYGLAYLRSSRIEDVTLSMHAAPGLPSHYQAYQPDSSRNTANLSCEDATPNRSSWTPSPLDLQQSLPPPGPPTVAPSSFPHLGPSIFGNRAVLDSPYQEPVAWANSTQFGSSSVEEQKAEIQENVHESHKRSVMPKENRRYFRHPRHISEPWKPGFWPMFPWLGFGALFLAVVLTGLSTGIIIASKGTHQTQWRIGSDSAQPAVYLSINELFINLLMLYALAQGVVIRFWRQLLHGTTLSSVHDTYDSANPCSAIQRLARLHFNRIATASTLTFLSLARGPLLQRSTTLSPTTSTYTTHSAPLTIGILLTLFSVAAIFPLYAGFWELGRPVSLNPVEVARAFGATLMEGLDGNATADTVCLERGGLSIKYGVVERYGSGHGKKLRVEETSRTAVRTPSAGEIFS